MSKSLICLFITISLIVISIIPFITMFIYSSDKYYNYDKFLVCSRITFINGCIDGIWTIIQLIILSI